MKTKLSLFVALCCVALLLASCAVVFADQLDSLATENTPNNTGSAAKKEASASPRSTTMPYWFTPGPSLQPATAGDTTATTVPEPVLEATSKNDEPWPYAHYFDYEATYKPTYDEIISLGEGIPIRDVVARIGKPHSRGPLSGLTSLEWQLADGRRCVAICAYEEVRVGMQSNFETMMNEGYVAWFYFE